MTTALAHEHAVYETYTDGTTHPTPTVDRESAILLAKHGQAHLDGPGPHRLRKVEAVERAVVDGVASAWLPIGEGL